MIERWIVDNEPSKRYPIYTRGNVGEVFPLPVSPLTWTLAAIPASEPGWRRALARFGAFDLDEFDPANIEILGCFGGYAYLNVSITRIFAVRTPGLTPEQIDYSLWGEMPGVPPYQAQPTDESPAHSERIQQTLNGIFSATDLPDLRADQSEMADLRAGRPDFSELSNRELVSYSRDRVPIIERLFSQHLFISLCASVPLGVVQGVCGELGDPSLAMRLVAGVGDVDSAAPSYAMWSLGRMIAGSKVLTAAFDAGVDGIVDRLRASGDGDADRFLAEFEKFIYDFGSRGPNEWETSSPSWETRPELALTAVDRMRLAQASEDPVEKNRRLAAEREALAPTVLAQLEGNPEVHGQMAAAIHACQVFLPARERTKTTIIRLVNELRVANNALGARMVREGVYRRPTSGSMLCEAELDDFLSRPDSFAATIREREEHYASLFDLDPPFILDGAVPPLSRWPRRDRHVAPVDAGTTLQGIPGCPGHATGRARVVLDPLDPRGLEPGDVLIAPLTDPAWTPLFVPAGAVVVDVGAQLSHAIIVSRELGIPCVVSVIDATKKIPDGAKVTVDGTAGTVTVH